MSEPTVCSSCNEPLKGGWSSSPNKLLTEKEIQFLNLILCKNQASYCEKCGGDSLIESKTNLDIERSKILKYLKENIFRVRIVTTHLPHNWQYEAISIVTGQSVTGTGLFSEVKSDFTDFFGMQSGSFNKKLSEGEKLCFSQLRAKALDLGANAIIGTDIDYGDVGGGKGMLMVCAAGTAVKVTNIEVLGEDASIVNDMGAMSKRLIEIDNARRLVWQIE
jgi:uncharacterized protein YbjQ (UPF0145 family)